MGEVRQRRKSTKVEESATVRENEASSKVVEALAKQKEQVSRKTEHESMSLVLGELRIKNSWHEKRASLMRGALLIVVHSLVGVLCMMHLEQWSLHDAVYFSIVTLTTVGYGDMFPTNTFSKIFVVYYVLVSITLISSYLSDLVGVIIDHHSTVLSRRLSRHAPSRAYALFESISRSLGLITTHGNDVGDALSVFASATLLGLLLSVGFAIYVLIEDLSSIDAAYATIVSASTVGFGDLKPTNTTSKLVMTVWLVFATIAVVKLVSDFENAREKVVEQNTLHRLLNAHMDNKSKELLFKKQSQVDIDWGDFVCAVLLETGKIESEDVESLKTCYASLNSKSITKP